MITDATKSNVTRLLGMLLAWAAGRYHLSTDQVALIASDVSYVGAAAAFAYGMFEHWNMKKVPDNSTALKLPASVVVPPVGQSINLTPAQGLAKVVGVLLVGFLVLQAVPARAATPATTLAQINTDLLQKLAADATAALADANANNDVIAAGCYAAIEKIANAKLTTANTTGGGLLTGFQKVRDVTRLNASPQGTDLIVGCAPLVQDAKLNFVQFFTNIGGLVLLKGIIPLP